MNAIDHRGDNGVKLIVAIVDGQYCNQIIDQLTRANYQATRVSTTGGFLRRGNTTLLIGVENNRVDDVFKQIALACMEIKPNGNPNESCVTAFVLNTQQNLKI